MAERDESPGVSDPSYSTPDLKPGPTLSHPYLGKEVSSTNTHMETATVLRCPVWDRRRLPECVVWSLTRDCTVPYPEASLMPHPSASSSTPIPPHPNPPNLDALRHISSLPLSAAGVINLVDVPSVRAVALYYNGGQGSLVYLATPALLTVTRATVTSWSGLGFSSPGEALFYVGGQSNNNTVSLLVTGGNNSNNSTNSRQLAPNATTTTPTPLATLTVLTNVTNVVIQDCHYNTMPQDQAIQQFGFDPFARDEPLLHVATTVRLFSWEKGRINNHLDLLFRLKELFFGFCLHYASVRRCVFHVGQEENA